MLHFVIGVCLLGLQLDYAETIQAIFTILGEGDKWPRKKAKMLVVIRITFGVRVSVR